ncbi:Uncharacterised protein [Bordetella pertussis]|nr:Uncharacterised protein [Bordetella pertussis]
MQVVAPFDVVQLAHAAAPWNPRASASKVGATPCPAGLLRLPSKAWAFNRLMISPAK